MMQAWQEYPKKEIVDDFPLGLDIELTNRCNLSCEMCPFHSESAVSPFNPADMPFNTYERIINEGAYKGLKSVKLNYSGEPLLYNQLIDAIIHAKSKNIDVKINTNGLLLSNEMCLKLINSGLDMLILTDYDMKQQHVNLKRLITLREAHGEPTPFVRVKSNNREKWLGLANEITPNIYFDYHDQSKDYSVSDFKCEQPWQRLLILADGTICKCGCGHHVKSKEFNNINNMSIEMAWQSLDMLFIRKCHSERMSHLISMCQGCAARKDYINKVNDRV